MAPLQLDGASAALCRCFCRLLGALFCSLFQAPQRVYGTQDDPAAKDHLRELSLPAWQEVEMSIECDPTRACVDRRDLNPLVVSHAKWQPDVEGELPRGPHVEDVKRDVK